MYNENRDQSLEYFKDKYYLQNQQTRSECNREYYKNLPYEVCEYGKRFKS